MAGADEAFQVRAASHSLESQLVLQRVTQRFQRCVSQVTSPTWLAAKSKPRHQLSSANVVAAGSERVH
eukprot:3032358-Rhodomonas_salina.3